MKFSFRNEVIFISFLMLILLFSTSCIKEDHWIDWKNINEKWYEAHKNDQNFTQLSSGVSYRVIEKGSETLGTPQLSTTYIYLNYEGRFYNDSVFDEGTNVKFLLGTTVDGFQEVLKKMNPGDSVEIYIPWEQGYGSNSYIDIPPYSTLKFNIRLNKFYNPQY